MTLFAFSGQTGDRYPHDFWHIWWCWWCCCLGCCCCCCGRFCCCCVGGLFGRLAMWQKAMSWHQKNETVPNRIEEGSESVHVVAVLVAAVIVSFFAFLTAIQDIEIHLMTAHTFSITRSPFFCNSLWIVNLVGRFSVHLSSGYGFESQTW